MVGNSGYTCGHNSPQTIDFLYHTLVRKRKPGQGRAVLAASAASGVTNYLSRAVSPSAACAAARRAIGTRNGEQLT